MHGSANRILGMAFAGAAAVGFSTAAMAAPSAPAPQRIRGTVSSISGHSLAIQSYSGSKTDIMLTSGTKYAWVVKSSLSSISHGDFIGTAATGPAGHMTAQEVVIFPPSMKGTGEGHYPWSMPSAVARNDAGGGSAPVHSTMTNGTVASTSMTKSAASVHGTMTNGTVASTKSQSGGKTLTISYNNGQKVEVMVPPNVPVVRFRPASKSIVKQGEKAFVVAGAKGGTPTAMFVAVGKNGLMPPM